MHNMPYIGSIGIRIEEIRNKRRLLREKEPCRGRGGWKNTKTSSQTRHISQRDFSTPTFTFLACGIYANPLIVIVIVISVGSYRRIYIYIHIYISFCKEALFGYFP
jgi:hypothetical protein